MIDAAAPDLFDQVEEALKDVIDPELGVNVVDLGLVYELGWDEEKDALIIYMTLTTAECPLQDDISAQTAQALAGLVDKHEIEWVWIPAWRPTLITQDGREMMRALGFNI